MPAPWTPPTRTYRFRPRRPTRSSSTGPSETSGAVVDKVQAAVKTDEPAPDKPVTQKALGLDLAALSKDLRTRYKIKDTVKGVVITGVDASSSAADKRLTAGDVIVEIAQEAVGRARAIGAGEAEARAYQVWGASQFRWEKFDAAREPFELHCPRQRVRRRRRRAEGASRRVLAPARRSEAA